MLNQVLLIFIGVGVLVLAYLTIRKNRAAFSRQALSRSFMTMGILALILIAVIALGVFTLKWG